MRTLTFIILLAFLNTHPLFSQDDAKVGDVRFPNSTGGHKFVMVKYDEANRTCTDEKYSLTSRGRIKVLEILADDMILIDLTKSSGLAGGDDNFAIATDGNKYCVTKDDWNNKFQTKRPSDARDEYGVLAVPFKARFNPTTIGSSGEIGAYYARYLGSSAWMLGMHGGLTFISLNDINSETPESKTGVALGLSLINAVSQDFQIGIVSGVDFFDGVEDWAYGYNPWISFQVGYMFQKKKQ